MCTSLPSAQHSQPPDHNPADITADLAALTKKLHEVTTSLTAVCQRHSQTQNHINGKLSVSNDVQRPDQPTPCETRCYTLPGHILDEERELLAAHKAASWQELFDKAHDQLYATVMLMEHISEGDKIDGFFIQIIAGNLMVPLEMLSRLCSLIADFRLTKVVKVTA